MRKRQTALLLTVVALSLSACGTGQSADTEAERTKTPSETSNQCGEATGSAEITASKSLFDTDCIAAAAGQPLTLTFRNDDPYQHNFAVLKMKGGEKLFASPLLEGTTVTPVEVPAQSPGSYWFECNIHPLIMSGDYLVPSVRLLGQPDQWLLAMLGLHLPRGRF